MSSDGGQKFTIEESEYSASLTILPNGGFELSFTLSPMRGQTISIAGEDITLPHIDEKTDPKDRIQAVFDLVTKLPQTNCDERAILFHLGLTTEMRGIDFQREFQMEPNAARRIIEMGKKLSGAASFDPKEVNQKDTLYTVIAYLALVKCDYAISDTAPQPSSEPFRFIRRQADPAPDPQGRQPFIRRPS